MTHLHKHITVLLMMAVFSLTMHVGVYHVPDVDSDHAQEQGHTDSETCIAGLAHVQLSIKPSVPSITWLLVGIISPAVETAYQYGVELPHAGRAPPQVNTSITI
jgi:hypothetical protein